jgi:hypothetical protein
MAPNIETSSARERLNFFFDAATREKIDRHLSDINDTISDEDIRNVITDIRSGNSDLQSSRNSYNDEGAISPVESRGKMEY